MDWSFAEVVNLIKAGHPFGRMEGFYVPMEEWQSSPLTARIHAFQFDDAEEFDDVAGVPVVAASRGLRTLLVISNLEDVLNNLFERDVNASLDDCVTAVNYYREYDSFQA